MVGGTSEQERLDEERRDGETGRGDRQGDQGGVDPAVPQPLQDFGCLRLTQRQGQDGKLLPQCSQHKGKQIRPQVWMAARTRRPVRGAPRPSLARTSSRCASASTVRPGGRCSDRRSQHHPSVAAFEENEAQGLFELADLHAECGLAHIAAFGRPSEVILLGNGDGIFQIPEGQTRYIHRLCLSQPLRRCISQTIGQRFIRVSQNRFQDGDARPHARSGSSRHSRREFRMSDQRPILTTAQGHPVRDNQSTRTVGERGPATLENYQFIEKITHFDRERIPEARRPCPRRRRPWVFRSLWQDRQRACLQVHPRPRPERDRREDADVRALFHRGWRQGEPGDRARPAAASR